MKSVAGLPPDELAALVCQALADAGITVTLTGGACVAIWTNGAYLSHDLDFVEQGIVSRREVRKVLISLGFTEKGRYFSHPDSDFLVEFPSGPLAVGDQPVHETAELALKSGTLRLLTPTDCIKDRLAAFFHWNDRQALMQAILVARTRPVDIEEIGRWSIAEGMKEKFAEFERASV